MSWTSPLTVASTIVPLPPESSVRSMCGSRCATAAFMTSADCSTNGSCISPRPKSSPTVRMPASRWSLMMSSALCPVASASSRSALQALGLAVDDAPLQPLPEGQGGQLRGAVGARGGGVDTLEHVEEHLQGVVRDVPVGVAPAAVVDEVEGDLALVLGDPRHREDLGRVHDRRVEPRLDGLVQEHRVEHDPSGGVEAEGDVRDAERGLHLRVAALDLADRLDGRQRRRGASPPGRWRSGRSGSRRGCRSTRMPQRPVSVSISRTATATLCSTVRAWPCSSIVSATTAAPCSRTIGMIRANRLPGPSPSSKLTQLTTARPPSELEARPRPRRARWSRAPAAGSTRSRAGSRPRACRRRRRGPRSRRRRRAGGRRRGSGRGRWRRTSSQRPASIASRKALEPLAFVRSPIERYDVSCRNGTCW